MSPRIKKLIVAALISASLLLPTIACNDAGSAFQEGMGAAGYQPRDLSTTNWSAVDCTNKGGTVNQYGGCDGVAER